MQEWGVKGAKTPFGLDSHFWAKTTVNYPQIQCHIFTFIRYCKVGNRPKKEGEVLIHFYIQESAKKLLLTLVANFLGSRH